MKYFVTSLLILLFYHAHSQDLSLGKSCNGYIVTQTDSIPGKISVDLESNSLLVKTSAGIRTYPARLLKKAVLFTENGLRRTFVAGYWGMDQSAYLFEQLVEGDHLLLYRQGLKFDRFSEQQQFTPYYTMVEGSVYSLGNKKEIIRLFADKREIAGFVREYKLDVKIREDLILLFDHANANLIPAGSEMAIEER